MELRFENLTKEYDGKKVLDIKRGIVKSGSRTAVIGPNGSGKSTLINIIAGLDQPTEGKIYYGEVDHCRDDRGGENQATVAASCEIPVKDITLVFQKPYLISTTVEKNIAYPMELRGYSEETIDRRTKELMEELGLTEFSGRKSWKLSGGEIQKVALARALSFRPKLLLLDEPTANIDPATTAEIERMLVKINREEGTTIIVITHNLAQARRVCNELIFLNKGRLIESGVCGEMLSNPKQEITGKFIAGELLV